MFFAKGSKKGQIGSSAVENHQDLFLGKLQTILKKWRNKNKRPAKTRLERAKRASRFVDEAFCLHFFNSLIFRKTGPGDFLHHPLFFSQTLECTQSQRCAAGELLGFRYLTLG